MAVSFVVCRVVIHGTSSSTSNFRIASDSAGCETEHAFAEGAEHSRGDGVELADMPEAEFAKERSECRRYVRSIEDGAHRTVPHDGGVGNGVGAAEHRPDQRGDLTAGIGTFVVRHREVFVGGCEQAALFRQGHHRHQPTGRHEIRVVEACRGDRSGVR